MPPTTRRLARSPHLPKTLPLCLALTLGGLAAVAPALAGEHDCVLEPRMTVDVRAPVEGLIEQVFVDRGDRIRAGQTLLVLDSGLEKANLEQARYRATMVGAVKSGESRVEYATLKLQRREKLADGQFISLQDRDEAAAEKRLAEAELLRIEQLSATYRFDMPRFDQTLTPVGECGIEFVVRRRPQSEVEARGRWQRPATMDDRELRIHFNQYRQDMQSMKSSNQGAVPFQNDDPL